MKEHLAVSMRASSAHARSFFSDLSLHGFGNVQLNALHHDFSSMSDSGRRDLASTLRRNELRASGVDFLALPSNWESEPEQTLMNFGAAVSISEEQMSKLVDEIRYLEIIIGDAKIQMAEIEYSASIFRRPSK